MTHNTVQIKVVMVKNVLALYGVHSRPPDSALNQPKGCLPQIYQDVMLISSKQGLTSPKRWASGIAACL